MRLADQRFIDLLAAFRSPAPTPGGGSASALSGAVGASLLAMVAALPKPRVQNPDEQKRLDAARASCALLSEQLAALMDRDSEAYEAVVAAFRLPKGSDEEKQARSSRIQEALRLATETPLDVMRACLDAIQAGADVAALGNANASSDVEVGLELLMAGLRGAKLNVAINLGSIKDQAYVNHTTTRAKELEAEAESGRQTALRLLPASSR
ncbi:MAG TPA: cyclodeaminase/cyclohydrolase family protein [Vicinamibacterales bacterium]|nr:cyclodeaminase/cyclohydrolase family protein [Vicinamibacterales bacterium]